jgi:hypothetical protein
VQATVKKNIEDHGTNDGWYFVASPIAESITPSAANGLLTNQYELYYFDQSQTLEWQNIKAKDPDTHELLHPNFTIDNKVGYLYANSENTTLLFQGTLTANTSATDLVYSNAASLKGFNLIGNPYPCNAYVNKSFYVLNETGSGFEVGSNPVPPCTAILVQAQDAGETAVFSKTETKSEPNIGILVKKADTKGNTLVDNAKVSFNSNDQLSKYDLSDDSDKLYFTQNGQDFAVAYADGENEMPLNFKVTQNGTYSISFDIESIELDYLHLIDNLTGNDVDLLDTPSYTFEAKTTDYASRFKLVFAPICEDADGDNAFAYLSDGNIIINNEDGATLQIVDMTGRVVFEGDAMNRVSTSGMTSGVYVLRLINEEKVMTQKIVIE